MTHIDARSRRVVGTLEPNTTASDLTVGAGGIWFVGRPHGVGRDRSRRRTSNGSTRRPARSTGPSTRTPARRSSPPAEAHLVDRLSRRQRSRRGALRRGHRADPDRLGRSMAICHGGRHGRVLRRESRQPGCAGLDPDRAAHADDDACDRCEPRCGQRPREPDRRRARRRLRLDQRERRHSCGWTRSSPASSARSPCATTRSRLRTARARCGSPAATARWCASTRPVTTERADPRRRAAARDRRWRGRSLGHAH